MLSDKMKSELCLRCLECCKLFYIPVSPDLLARRVIEFHKARGCSTILLHGNIPVVVIPFQCPHLTPEGCDIYGERPEVCKSYDGTDDPLMKDKCLWFKKNRKKNALRNKV